MLLKIDNDSVTNVEVEEEDEVAPYTKTTTEEKIIVVVASLKEDSISRIRASSFGTFVLLKVCITIAASVDEITAANKKLKSNGKWIKYIIIKPITIVDVATPNVESNNTDILTGLYSL
jgi:hypothetical protein